VRIGKSARYALYGVLDMAAAGGRPVSTSAVAARYRVPAGALAKVLQSLVRAGIVAGSRGVGGGYRLARRPEFLTVLDVLSVFEAPRPPGSCLPAEGCTGPSADATECRLRSLFDEVDEQARCTFASVTLETLVRSPVPPPPRPALLPERVRHRATTTREGTRPPRRLVGGGRPHSASPVSE